MYVSLLVFREEAKESGSLKEKAQEVITEPILLRLAAQLY